MIANIIPLRRTGSAHHWFSYHIPEDLQVLIGQRVQIPFIRQSIQGIVWSIEPDSSRATQLKTITQVIDPNPVISGWQHFAIQQISNHAMVSTSLLVNRALPEFTQKYSSDATTLPYHEYSPSLSTPPPLVWWYSDRQLIRQQIMNWVTAAGKQSRLVITPTIEEAELLAQQFSSPAVVSITSKTTAAEFRKYYQQILSNTITRVIGTQRALTLPFVEAPEILIDQEEHPAHKQTRQYPKLDTSRVVELFGHTIIYTSPAPSVSLLYRHQKFLKTAPKTSGRTILRLDQPKSHAWVTPELETILTDLDGGSAVIIVPSRDFAQSISCRDCGWQFACPHCQRVLGLKKSSSELLECRFCHQSTALSIHCPRCQSVSWKFSGSGLRRMIEEFPAIIPNQRFTSSWPAIGEPGIWIGTYQAYQHLAVRNDWRTIVVLNGDSLRAWPDFSAEERAWQYLARLQSFFPQAPLVVQTYAHQDPFWQRWIHGDSGAWYHAEFATREKLQLPPIFDQWIVSKPRHKNPHDVLKQLPESVPGITISPPTTSFWNTAAISAASDPNKHIDPTTLAESRCKIGWLANRFVATIVA